MNQVSLWESARIILDSVALRLACLEMRAPVSWAQCKVWNSLMQRRGLEIPLTSLSNWPWSGITTTVEREMLWGLGYFKAYNIHVPHLSQLLTKCYPAPTCDTWWESSLALSGKVNCHLTPLDKPLGVNFSVLSVWDPPSYLVNPQTAYYHHPVCTSTDSPLCTPHSIFCSCEHVNIVHTLNSKLRLKFAFTHCTCGWLKYYCSIYFGGVSWFTVFNFPPKNKLYQF